MIHMPTGVVGACRRAVAGSVGHSDCTARAPRRVRWSVISISVSIVCRLPAVRVSFYTIRGAHIPYSRTGPEERRVGSWRSQGAVSTTRTVRGYPVTNIGKFAFGDRTIPIHARTLGPDVQTRDVMGVYYGTVQSAVVHTN